MLKACKATSTSSSEDRLLSQFEAPNDKNEGRVDWKNLLIAQTYCYTTITVYGADLSNKQFQKDWLSIIIIY